MCFGKWRMKNVTPETTTLRRSILSLRHYPYVSMRSTPGLLFRAFQTRFLFSVHFTIGFLHKYYVVMLNPWMVPKTVYHYCVPSSVIYIYSTITDPYTQIISIDNPYLLTEHLSLSLITHLPLNPHWKSTFNTGRSSSKYHYKPLYSIVNRLHYIHVLLYH